MKLTSDYRRVRALFNTPLEQEVEFKKDFSDTVTTRFEVGPFTYVVEFDPENDRGTLMRVAFRLDHINVTGEELVQMMSKVKSGHLKNRLFLNPEREEPVSLEEAEKVKEDILTYFPYDELEITGPYVLKIFGMVLNIVKDYVKRHPVGCIVFSAEPEARARIYQRMMKSAFPRASIRLYPSEYGAGTEIKVCFI
jgi:hypothetical protein